MMTYKTAINNQNTNINDIVEQNQPQVQIEMIETKPATQNWREFLETQEFYLEAAGN